MVLLTVESGMHSLLGREEDSPHQDRGLGAPKLVLQFRCNLHLPGPPDQITHIINRQGREQMGEGNNLPKVML